MFPALSHLRYIPLILPLTLAACTTIPAEPETFKAELISFRVGGVLDVEPSGMPFEVPGYYLKLRGNTLPSDTINPDRKLYEFALMDCANEDYIMQSPWINARDRNDDGSALYTAQLYKDAFDRLDLPDALCAQILIGSGKKGARLKRPFLVSNKIQLELPN